MATIHHNTVKKAKANGLEIRVEGTGFVVLKDGGIVPNSNALNAKDALDLALLELAPAKKTRAPKDGAKSKKRKSTKRKAKKSGDEDGEDEGDDEEKATASIVKAKYREKYRPHKMTNGDNIAKKCHELFMTKKDEDTKKPRLDFDAFVKFAKANGVWVEAYRTLKNRHGERNNGLIRMNIVNRIRAKARRKEEIIWPETK